VPEANRRRVVKGLKQAERLFAEYVAKRVRAETSTADLERELLRLKRETERDLRVQRGGV